MAMNAEAWERDFPTPEPSRLHVLEAELPAAVTEPIRNWRDASDALAREFPDLRAALTDQGWSRLLGELLEVGSVGAGVRVLKSWYMTMLARSDPRYEERRRQAGTGRAYSPEELKKALGL